VETGDPDIVKPFRSVSEELQGDKGFFGYRMVRSAGGAYGDAEGGMGGTAMGGIDESECPGGCMIFSLGKKATKEAGFSGVDPGHENGLFFGAEPASDSGDLRDGFSGAVDNFRGAQAVLPL